MVNVAVTTNNISNFYSTEHSIDLTNSGFRMAIRVFSPTDRRLIDDPDLVTYYGRIIESSG